MSSTSPSSPAPKTQARGRPRRWLWLGALALAVLIVLGLWPKPLPVETAVVSRGELVVSVSEEGMTRVRNRYVISAPVSGQLRRIDWKAGAPVRAGETPLAVLETSGADFLDTRTLAQAEARVRGAEAAREAALAQRERAAAAAKLASADYERAQKLFSREVLSPQELESAQMRAIAAQQEERAAEFSLRVADFELEQARAVVTRGAGGSAANAEPLVITSPVDGKILRVYQESARVVPAGFDLLEVGDETDLEVRIEVLSRDGVAIRPGARVWIEQWGGPYPLEARVRLVEPSAFTKISALGVEEQRVYVVVDFVDPVEKRATLGDNYRVEGRIVTWEGSDVLQVPAGALFQRAGEWQTFVLEGGRARLKTVEVDRSNGMQTEVLSGLNEGERVIVYPGDQVRDGVRVTPLTVSAR